MRHLIWQCFIVILVPEMDKVSYLKVWLVVEEGFGFRIVICAIFLQLDQKLLQMESGVFSSSFVVLSATHLLSLCLSVCQAKHCLWYHAILSKDSR